MAGATTALAAGTPTALATGCTGEGYEVFFLRQHIISPPMAIPPTAIRPTIMPITMPVLSESPPLVSSVAVDAPDVPPDVPPGVGAGAAHEGVPVSQSIGRRNIFSRRRMLCRQCRSYRCSRI